MFEKLRSYPMIVLLLPLVAAILVCEQVRTRWGLKDMFSEEEETYAFVLTGDAKATTKCERFETEVIACWDSVAQRWEKADGEVFLYLLRDSTRTMPVRGDTVVARTKIEERYRRMYSAFAARWEVRTCGQRLEEPLQKRLYGRLEAAGLSGDELATTGALTLGYKEDLDPELKRHFQASGAAHVLAVSGLHTGIIYGLLLWLLTLGGRFKPMHEDKLGRCIVSTVIIATMWAYAWLTGMTPSVVRAVVMVTLVEVAHMCYRQALSLNTIAAAAVLILLVRPSDLWSVSFQLSFSATAAIVVAARDAEKIIHRLQWKQKWLGRIAGWILGTIIISLAAQLGTLPITMYYFGQISNYFLLTNLIVLPIATILVPCGLLTIVLGGSFAGVWIGKVTHGLAWTMNHLVGWIESLPGSTTSVHIDLGMVAAYYLIFILFCTFFAEKR